MDDNNCLKRLLQTLIKLGFPKGRSNLRAVCRRPLNVSWTFAWPGIRGCLADQRRRDSQQFAHAAEAIPFDMIVINVSYCVVSANIYEIFAMHDICIIESSVKLTLLCFVDKLENSCSGMPLRIVQ
ncbi:hypothetical protein PUN28_003218 [Cardiocondyla obscurior]|uniref:Uncharacterized protein n=1 Tax=Cardiocondyla obscurior TaxID=286306 RepID=A0AAW2GJZ3_9HYME